MGQPTRRFFRYSTWDVVPALGGVLQVAFMLACCWAYPFLPAWALAVPFLIISLAYCWNLQCVSHNFIHNPFFRSPWLNRAYSVVETWAIGVPQVLYHHYHMNHHAGDNDAQGPDGTTRDWSSIYRYGRNGLAEPLWRYSLVSFFRVEVGPVLGVARKHRQHGQVVVEGAALAALWAAIALYDWRCFAFFYLPSYFFGWVLSYAQGYLEHSGAQPGNPFANSVSSYNRLYNLLWFNNGYHQEHHWDPKRHWTQMAVLHAEIRPQLQANRTRTIRGPHLTAPVEDLLARYFGFGSPATLSAHSGPQTGRAIPPAAQRPSREAA